MTNPIVPDYQRVHSAEDPRLLAAVPPFGDPQENANLVQTRQTLTINRAGSNRGNPILAGLGGRVTIGVGTTDKLVGVWLYQGRTDPGLNLLSQAPQIAPGLHALDLVFGSGQTVAGSPSTGAKRNFLRWETAFGKVERQFYIKTYDSDAVTLNGFPALDSETLEPVEVVCPIIAGSRAWLDVVVDFFPSWNDEFGAVHVGENAALNPGFLKAYGGALFVSVFDTGEDEGVGTQVDPFTDATIADKHSIQVQNTAGLKELTFRFRSKAGSSYFVDVPVKLRLTEDDNCAHSEPGAEPCTALLLKADTDSVEGSPIVASTPGVQVVLGPNGTALPEDLLVITVHGATVGETVELRVTQKRVEADAQALGGCKFTVFGSPEDYLPAIQPGDAPVLGAPWRDPERYTIALSAALLRANQIALVEVQVKDGIALSVPVAVPGPKIRNIVGFAAGGTGGGIPCAY